MFKNNYLWILIGTLSLPSIAGWSGFGNVTRVTSHNGIHLIYTTIEDATCDGKGRFWWPKTDDDSGDMLAISLAALMSGKKVRLVQDEVNKECMYSDQFNKATHIAISAD